MKKVLPLVFALSICSTPLLAWGWGGEAGGCPYSKDKSNQEGETQQVEESQR